MAVVFENVRIFDGKNKALTPPASVLVEGDRITKIASAELSAKDEAGNVTLIRGRGRTLMPGLIDAHWHAMWATVPLQIILTGDIAYINILAARAARETLLRGFTSVRDAGGPVFSLKKAIDDGTIAGPRIYPSGALISQTSGHGDFRLNHEIPKAAGGPPTHMEIDGHVAIADSADEVRLRAREQLRQGASQVKVMAGGGCASPFDPLDAVQYTQGEIRAAVEAAEDWGTYVLVHAYTPRSIRRAVAAGVKCIEHGHLIDEATAEILASSDTWLCLQPFLDDGDAIPLGAEARKKWLEVTMGTDKAYALAQKYNISTAFGTDTLFDARLAARQGAQLAKLTKWYSSADVLAMATSRNAELLSLSGPRNPYQGRIGIIEEGALADLLLVNGNPLEQIDLITDPETQFAVVMKGGELLKNEA